MALARRCSSTCLTRGTRSLQTAESCSSNVGLTLTWYAYQDQADRLGGCWEPRFQLRVGFGLLHDLTRRHGLADGIRRYNGSGSAAVAYSLGPRQGRKVTVTARWG